MVDSGSFFSIYLISFSSFYSQVTKIIFLNQQCNQFIIHVGVFHIKINLKKKEKKKR